MLGGLAAVMAMLTPAAQPALADHTTLDLLPSPLLLSPGDQDVLDVWVFGLDGPDRLTGYDLTLDYDPAVIIIDAVTGGNAPFDATPTSTIDNEIGRVTFSTNQTQGGATEDVLIARISVTAVGELDASTGLTFSSVELTGSLDQVIDVGLIVGGRAAVSGTAVMIGTSAVSVGNSITAPVTIIFTPEGGLAGYNISVGYDPAIIRIDGVFPGEPPFGGTPIFSVNEEQSFVNIVGFHGERPGLTGKTIALNMQVTGLIKGSSPLVITVKDLVNAIDATSFTALTSNGSVRVVSESAGGPQASTSTTETFSVAVDGDSALDGAVVSYITPAAGAVIALPDGSVILTIPAGAVAESGFVAMRLASDNPSPPVPLSHDLGNTVEVNFLDSEGGLLSDVLLLEQAILSMGFTDSELDTWGPDGILIQRYEPVLGRWLSLATTIDTDKMVASALTDRFSVFGLTFRQTGEATSSGESEQGEETIATTASNPATSEDNSALVDEDDGQISLVIMVLIVLAVMGALGGVGILFLRSKNPPTTR